VDGSGMAACINAATLALVSAGIALKDIVCSCTAAEIDFASGNRSTQVIDVNGSEQMSKNLVTVTCLPKTENLVQLESTGRLHQDRLRALLAAAKDGCLELHKVLETAIREYVKKLASSIESSG